MRTLLNRKYDIPAAEDPFASDGVQPADMIFLNRGDPDILTPKVILDAAFQDAYNGHTKYTDTRGYPELRDEIRKFYRERYGMRVKDEEICVTTSGQFGMYAVCQTVINPGDEVLIIEPFFTPYRDAVMEAGGIPVYVSTVFEEDFQIRAERLEEAVTPRTRALIINTPNNPTGAVYSRQTLEMIAAFAERHDLTIIADDIYTSYDFTGPFVPIASLPGMFERTVTVNSFSKNFVMTGMRIGNIVAPADVVRAVKQVIEKTTYSAPSISQRCALHGYRHFAEFEASVVQTFKERTEYSFERLSRMPFIEVMPVSGSFYIFPNVRKSGMDGTEFARRLREECHVVVIPGIFFGPSGRDHFRISCTAGMDQLKEAYDRMERMHLQQTVKD